MSEKLQRFTKLLRDMFELEKSDLDFGIYRIMNIRKNEINNFIENTLASEVNSILSKYATDNSQVRKRIEEIEKQCESVGVKVEDSKLREEYAEYKAQLSSGTGVAELESDVYSALYNFFSRYYDEGDFISKRRYKEGVYAIPYEGEEVKLYWANHDQYYIKTSENFRDYSFKVDVQGEKYTIHFKLVDANTEQNNNKESDDKKRQFILLDGNFLEAEGNELTIKFEYRVPASEQDSVNKLKDNTKLNKSAVDKIKGVVSENTDLKHFVWAINSLAPTDKNKTRTILEKHLETYVAKNTFDYFIHKDLRGFLNRELDFYIKAEIMHLDDLDTDNEVKANAYLAKVKAIKKVGRIIIDFLAQIEDFQKKLWLKKKFVVETNWCITLDKIDESFYPEIAANDAQRQEWVELYSIDEIAGDLMTVAYSNPLTVDFLKQNKNLVLDTKHFTTEFKERLVASIENLDEEINGLLIHSENFQALNLLQEKYREKIDCVYIDPPYNAKSSEIMYKNGFKHSSWNSMIFNGLIKVKTLMSENGIIEFAIDDYELKHSLLLFETVFGEDNFIANIGIVHNPRGRNDDKFFGTSHEYMTVFAKNIGTAEIGLFELSESDISVYNKTDGISNYSTVPYIRTGNNSYRFERPNLFYPIYYNPESNELSLEKKDGWIELLPINSKGEEKTWRWGRETFLERCKTELVVKKDGQDYKIFKKRRLEGAGKKPKTIWADSKYDASSHGIMLLRNMFGLGNHFSYPKSLYTVYDALFLISEEESIILDYFAGSGTTGHAVINLNREDGGNRKYILVEMGNYFNTVTKPRIKKVVYAKDWKDGKPQNRNTGVSQIFKYIRLESYEDTLNNIELSRTPEQEKQLRMDASFFNEYLVSYMLDIESRGSLLNLDRFKEPFAYKMKIAENNETKETTIDLVETFNYLLGLAVTRQKAAARFNAVPDPKGEYENAVMLTEDKEGKYIFKTVEGIMPNGDNALVIWRNLTEDLTADNAALDAFFLKYRAESGCMEFSLIYVNGDNNLENLKGEKEQWKVHLIELEFKKRMFEGV
ncbi:adenine-specific DNA-methyltransferase [Geosporobacter subterraneus DSM 17957]|uniref:Adenine-specific DNA-methyltransferase n=1 Tax=Geosporobacter subterraneus DSM 17957 TaxID=1121919 RepID=A0A1M6EJR9_9FIRM|nr:site-specific DNA-methyltransferase [Geosporobacter subterraneus]SHI85714.1 adenine-specific DNA-methyltransferase [Geosporobacter subterraneus DSM 17957]